MEQKFVEPFAAGGESQIPRRALSIAETAGTLGISQTSVRRLIARGKLRACRQLRHILIPVAEIERLLN
jgi:excisionase family DNA binding protein